MTDIFSVNIYLHENALQVGVHAVKGEDYFFIYLPHLPGGFPDWHRVFSMLNVLKPLYTRISNRLDEED